MIYCEILGTVTVSVPAGMTFSVFTAVARLAFEDFEPIRAGGCGWALPLKVSACWMGEADAFRNKCWKTGGDVLLFRFLISSCRIAVSGGLRPRDPRKGFGDGNARAGKTVQHGWRAESTG